MSRILNSVAEQIVEQLQLAADLYTNDGESFLTDAEYDRLELQLRNIDPNHPFLQQVGAEVRGGKVLLPHPMGSLDQVYEGDAQKWVEANNWQDEIFVISDKLDGTSGLIVYDRRGKFQAAYTRGNGTHGADITRHVKRMPNIPQTMAPNAIVRVEFIMAIETFAKFRAAAIENGERVYKNPRNYVAGRINASESPEEFYKNIYVFATSLIEPVMSKSGQFNFLEDSGWMVPGYNRMIGSELTDERLTNILDEVRAGHFEIDGLVIDINDAEIRKNLTRKSSSLNPAYSRKFKVGEETNLATTIVRNVSYEVSKNGYLKPRVQFDTVELKGVSISFASGFNCKFIKDNGIGPGAKILITRSGDVIPYIKEVIEKVEPQLPLDALGEMEWSKNEVDMILLDVSDNREYHINRAITAFTILEIPHLREGSIAKLYDAGFTRIPAIIKATREEMIAVLGDSAGEKIFNGLREKLNPVEPYILAAASQTLGRGIGRRKLIKLQKTYGSFNLTPEYISAVDGFDDITANLIFNNLHKYLEFLNEVEGFYTHASAEESTPKSDRLAHLNVCFTGVRDKDLEQRIQDEGGSIATGVNAKTTHLVCKDPSSRSGKMQKARDLNIPVIDLAAAIEMFK